LDINLSPAAIVEAFQSRRKLCVGRRKVKRRRHWH